MVKLSEIIKWETLLTTLHISLIWKAFPFHPFQGENQQSNRKPTTVEITLCKEFFATVNSMV
jgi:hypothetical protein